MYIWWLTKSDSKIIVPVNYFIDRQIELIKKEFENEKSWYNVLSSSVNDYWMKYKSPKENTLGIEIPEKLISILPKIGIITKSGEIIQKQETNYVELAVQFAKQRKQKEQEVLQKLEEYKIERKKIEEVIEEGLKQWDGINGLKFCASRPGYNQSYFMLRNETRTKVTIKVSINYPKNKTLPISISINFNKIGGYIIDRDDFNNPEDALIKISELLSEEM